MKPLFASLLFLLLPGVADAQVPAEPKPDARALTESGLRRFKVGEYGAAVAEFKQAYVLDPQPTLLFDIAQAHRLAGDCENAKRFYLNYLHDAPGAPNRAAVDKRVTEMQACVDSGASRPLVVPAPTPTIEVAPTPPEPVVVPPPVEPTPVAPTARLDRPRTRRALRIAGLAALGVGVVALSAGIAMGVRAQQASDEVGALYMTGGRWDASLASTDARGRTASAAAIGLYTAGAVVLAAGAVMTALGFRPVRARRVDASLSVIGSILSGSCAF